jgi:hypothetical protein
MAIRGVSASEKLLLLVLANFADEGMACWPSHKRLADDTGLSQRTILTLMKGLEERKIISREERTRSDGSRASDKITLHFSGEVISPRGETVSGGGEATSPGWGNEQQGGGEMVSPLTTFEPSTEPSEEPKRAVSARDLAKQIWELQPVLDGKRRSTCPDVERALGPVLKHAQPDEVVNACRGYYALPASRKEGGAFAMGAARLLQRDRWKEFVGTAAPTARLATVKPFPDEAIRNAIVAAKDEAWARSWLDPCSWEPERRVIVPRNGLAAQKLRSEVLRILQARKASIQELAA